MPFFPASSSKELLAIITADLMTVAAARSDGALPEMFFDTNFRD
jgi:hypothetical protein